MSSEELKVEISKILERVPEETLEEIYSYLKEIEEKSTDSITLSCNLNRILSEDRELLKRFSL